MVDPELLVKVNCFLLLQAECCVLQAASAALGEKYSQREIRRIREIRMTGGTREMRGFFVDILILAYLILYNNVAEFDFFASRGCNFNHKPGTRNFIRNCNSQGGF